MSATLGRQIGEKLLRVSIAVIGLLVLRLILSALPMLKSPMIYVPSSTPVGMPSPVAAGPGNPDPLTEQIERQMQDLQRGLAAQVAAGTLPEATSDYLMSLHLVIFPLTIAYAVVDTLIFVMLVLFGRNLASIVRSGYSKFPDLGQIFNFGILTAVVAAAYYSYEGILYPLLWPSHQDLYGWTFLVLGLAPLAGVVILVSRNMDRITGAVMHSGAKALDGSPTMQCGSCGQTLQVGTKFCPACGGAAVTVPGPVAAGTRFCPSCGVQNPQGTKFCGECGTSI